MKTIRTTERGLSRRGVCYPENVRQPSQQTSPELLPLTQNYCLGKTSRTFTDSPDRQRESVRPGSSGILCTKWHLA